MNSSKSKNQNDHETGTQPQCVPTLPIRKVTLWGAIGGVICVIATTGLLYYPSQTSIFYEISRAPLVQILAFATYFVVITFISAIWARAHAPITSILVALQLGLIAPATVSTAVSSADFYSYLGRSNPIVKKDSNFIDSSFKEANTNLILANAHAQTMNSNHKDDSKPSIFTCIYKAIIWKPC